MTLPSRVRVVQPINGVFADEKDSDDSGRHHMENKIRGAFGYINVDGPNTYLRPQKPNVDAHEVTLVFKFVKRDTGEPVNIPWMQFSFFDFDENDNNEPGDGRECLSASGFVEYALSDGSKVTETETVSNAGGINTGARLPASLLAALSAAPPLGVCAASASLRAQGSSARRYPEEGATTRLTH